jgi:hypothetical protein
MRSTGMFVGPPLSFVVLFPCLIVFVSCCPSSHLGTAPRHVTHQTVITVTEWRTTAAHNATPCSPKPMLAKARHGDGGDFVKQHRGDQSSRGAALRDTSRKPTCDTPRKQPGPANAGHGGGGGQPPAARRPGAPPVAEGQPNSAIRAEPAQRVGRRPMSGLSIWKLATRVM